jgi:hypothetical protein
MSSNTCSSCLGLPNAGIKGMYHYAWLTWWDFRASITE